MGQGRRSLRATGGRRYSEVARKRTPTGDTHFGTADRIRSGSWTLRYSSERDPAADTQSSGDGKPVGEGATTQPVSAHLSVAVLARQNGLCAAKWAQWATRRGDTWLAPAPLRSGLARPPPVVPLRCPTNQELLRFLRASMRIPPPSNRRSACDRQGYREPSRQAARGSIFVPWVR
jgi:hypothetical protein